jgi:hypothetical protein
MFSPHLLVSSSADQIRFNASNTARTQAEKPASLEVPEAARSPFSATRIIYRVATGAWHLGVTPGSIVRTVGPLSRRFTRYYADRRLNGMLGLSKKDCDALEQYMFEVLGARGSGEVRDQS